MISAQQIQEIFAQYKRHGWVLRRVLLSEATRGNLIGSLETLIGDESIFPAEIDAAWFSRSSGVGREAWELRRLSGSSFALVEVFEDDEDEAVREETLFELEQALISGKRKIDNE